MPQLRCLILMVMLFWLCPPAQTAHSATDAPERTQRVIAQLSRPLLAEAAYAAPAGESTPPELAKLGLRVWEVPASAVPTALAGLQRSGAVAFVETARAVQAQETPDDPGWGQQYGPANIQAPQAWDTITGAVSVTIAIVDTGIDLNHPDLQAKLVTGTTFVTGTTTPQDDNGHGTHVAGIAAAISNNALGIAGVNWGARLMPIKVLDRTGNGDDIDVAAGIVWATDHGAKVINLSLGGNCPSPTMEMAATYAYTSGVMLIAAAGNNGAQNVLCPAAYDTVIAVAATDQVNMRASFSSFGPPVDLAAPGASIYSTVWTPTSSTYGYKSGTSMAAPHVAGVAALLAGLPQFNTPDKIRAALEYTALDLGNVCLDPFFGHGLVQAYNALQYDPTTTHPAKCFTNHLPMIGR